MSKIAENFKDVIQTYGTPKTHAELSPAQMDSWINVVPDSLIDFWKEYGQCSTANGALWFPDPADFSGLMEIIFKNDPEIDHTKCHLIAYSAFGKCFIWSEEYQDISIDLIIGWCFAPGFTDNKLSENENRRVVSFAGALQEDRFDEEDSRGYNLLFRCKNKYGPLKLGECYGFFPALVMGGSGDLETVQRVDALAHFAILAQASSLTLMGLDENMNMRMVHKIGRG